MADKKNTNNFIKNITTIGVESKKFTGNVKNMFIEFGKLPWSKLPPIGWFYLIFITLIFIIAIFFIAPYISTR